MIKSDTANQLDLHSYLPPYRSLLSPHARYDYRTHSLIPISQNDLSLPFLVGSSAAAAVVAAGSSSNSGTTAKSKFKMKYKSLLSDVSRRTSILSLRKNLDQDFQSIKTSTSNSFNVGGNNSMSHSNANTRQHAPVQFKNLPIDILVHILEFVDDFDDYKCCLLINKQFYQLTKPLFYRSLSFTSSYKFALFVTYLRLNSEVGYYVKEIDLSGIKPSNFGIEEVDEEIEEENEQRRGANGNLHGLRRSLDDYQVRFDDHTDRNYQVVLAGWRDWKFKSNPLYSTHQQSPNPSAASISSNLTKVKSNSQILARSLAYSVRTNNTSTNSSTASSSSKIIRLSKYFKHRKRQRIVFDKPITNNSSVALHLATSSRTSASNSRRLFQQPHPPMNKLLFNYSSYRDIPIGYVLHTLNLCPNLMSINLANVSLAVDYEIDPKMAYKYQTYDLMNNYSKDLAHTINKLMSTPVQSDESIYSSQHLFRGGASLGGGVNGDRDSLRSFPFSAASVKSVYPLNQSSNNNNYGGAVNNKVIGDSSASSVYSFHPPTRPRYNSLLPPLPPSSMDTSYFKKGDGKVFLSDLNLKSINNNYLIRVQEKELLTTIANIHSNRFGIFNTLKYVNLSSMIWLTKSSIRDFISELLGDNPCTMSDDEDGSSLDTSSILSSCDNHCFQDLVIDLTDSGMYKNLLWAKRIDLKLIQGFRLASKIVSDEVLDVNEYNTRRDQVRRGRIGENYFS